MIALKKPYLLFIPLEVELHLTVVALVFFINHASTEVAAQNFEILPHVTSEELPTAEKDFLCIALLDYFVFESLFKFLVLHEMP